MTQRPLTTCLLGLLAVMFAIELGRGAVGDEAVLLGLGALPNSAALDGEYWRLFTYSLLHLTPLHFVMNVSALWWVGRMVERRLSVSSVLAIYGVAVLAGGLAIVMAHLRQPTPGSSVGASAGIFGLMGAALVLMYRADSRRVFGGSRVVKTALWALVVAGVGMSFLPGVSLWGHMGGLLAGVGGGWAGRLQTNPGQAIVFDVKKGA